TLLKRFALLSLAVALCAPNYAQRRPQTPPTPAPAPQTPGAPGAQTPGAPGAGGPRSAASTGPKPYKEVITEKAKTSKGLFSVHKVDDKYYFEIADSVLGRDIMAITRFSKIAAGAGLYGGEQANQQVIQFEKGPDNKVFLRVVTLIATANDSTQPIYKAVRNSAVDPIVAAFDVKALSKDSSGVVIDVTDFFKGDNQPVSLNAGTKRRLNLGGLASDRSYIESIRSYPINTEVRTVKTFSASAGGGFGAAPSPFPSASIPAASTAGAITMELNTSFLLLPKIPAAKRLVDPRIGFFADDYTVYSDDQQKVEQSNFIVRWRLEPKPEDVEKWKRGELVEPAKPIIYYIDPATPKKWRQYLIQGVNDWQAAFEKAGFKNAIMGKEWPENDPTMSLEDARFSVIRYFASDIQNAYGPNAHDPRSGEIIESHIGWYHNVMELLHDWYFVQTAAVDPDARKMKFDDDLMGNLIRFVSSHEVGHTLGLRHNMGSSSKTPVEKLRDKAWVEANGHTASIMDYARFNYVAQPEDNISKVGLFPRIGDYDKWAIEWGYGFAQGKDEEAQKLSLSKKYNERLAANPRIWFGTYEYGNFNDPRTQSEDLSDNAMKASEYGIKNLKRIMAKLPEYTKEEGDRYENLAQMYRQIAGQFNRYIGHVSRNIGGYYETTKSVEQTGDVYEVVPKATQKDAVAFLNAQVFSTPTWMMDNNILNKISTPLTNQISSIQVNALNSLLSASRLSGMANMAVRSPGAYNVDEFYADLKKGIFNEVATRTKISAERRTLQKAYVDRMLSILNPAPASGITLSVGGATGSDLSRTDVSSITRAHINQLRNELNAAAAAYTDNMSKYHLQDLVARIKEAMESK
ncbi:MAG: zinc-dependent metalloprotease, partial [Sphingobacteriales bacterium]